MNTTDAVIIVAAAAMIVAQGTKPLLVSPKTDATFLSTSSLALDEHHRNARDLRVQDAENPI